MQCSIAMKQFVASVITVEIQLNIKINVYTESTDAHACICQAKLLLTAQPDWPAEFIDLV